MRPPEKSKEQQVKLSTLINFHYQQTIKISTVKGDKNYPHIMKDFFMIKNYRVSGYFINLCYLGTLSMLK